MVRTLETQETSRALGVHRRTLYRWIEEERVPAHCYDQNKRGRYAWSPVAVHYRSLFARWPSSTELTDWALKASEKIGPWCREVLRG